MPSGAKKRKAAKKKLQTQAPSTLDTGSHPQGNEDSKSHDERESDGGEIEREEEEEKKVSSEEGVRLREESVTEEMREVKEDDDSKDVEIVKEVNLLEEGSKDIAIDTDGVEKENRNGLQSMGDRSSSSSSSVDKEVVIEKGNLVIKEADESRQQDDVSLSESIPGKEMIKPSNYLPEQIAVGIGGGAPEQVYNAIEERIPIEESEESNLLTKDVAVDNSAAADMVESGLEQNQDEVIPSSSDEKLIVSSERSEMVVVESIDEASGTSSATAEGEKGELPRSSVEVAVGTDNEARYVKDLETSERSEEQPLLVSHPQAVKRTSWKSCCGLFEVLSGSSSR